MTQIYFVNSPLACSVRLMNGQLSKQNSMDIRLQIDGGQSSGSSMLSFFQTKRYK